MNNSWLRKKPCPKCGYGCVFFYDDGAILFFLCGMCGWKRRTKKRKLSANNPPMRIGGFYRK